MKSSLIFKTGLVLSVVLLLTFSANAQTSFGLKVGMNGSTQSEFGAIYDNDNIRAGFNAGAFVEHEISDHLAIQLGVNYTQKGEKTNNLSESSPLFINDKCDYITMPLLFKASTRIDGTNADFYGVIGPYFGYLLNAKQMDVEENSGLKTDFRNDAGLSFGVGYAKPIFDFKLLLDLRYDMGLIQITDQ